MKILFISNEYPPDTGFGGIATYTRHAAEGMVMRGHCVHVICRSVNNAASDASENGVAVHRVVPGPYPLPQSRFFYPFRKLCYALIPQSLVRMAWAKTVAQTCGRLVRETGVFDIIEYPECGAEGHYLFEMDCLQKSVTVVRLHTPWEIIHLFDRLKEPFFDVRLQSFMERRSARRAGAVSAPSHAIAGRLSRSWRLNQINVYPNPLPVASRQTVSSGKDWLYTGRIELRKGVHLLVKAYAATCDAQRSPPVLRLVGRPYGLLPCGRPYGDYIRELIRETGMRERIIWIEGVPQQSVQEFISRSSVAFFPSLWENFPYACLEAMAGGCAVAASDCGGFPEMITHDRSGLLFETGNITALSAVMHRIIDEKDIAERLGAAALDYVKAHCAQSIVCAHAESFYQSLTGRT